MSRLLSLLFGLLLGSAETLAQAPNAQKDLVQASLVAEPTAVTPGQSFTVALRMVMKPKWHVYWRNPGDSGLPPEFAWNLPQGFSAGAIDWPTPERIPVQTLMNYGYEGEVALLVPITASASLPAGGVAIRAKVSYLVCEEICIPGSADLALDVPVAETGKEAAADLARAELFRRARAALPEPSPWPSRLTRDGKGWVLTLDAAGLKADGIRSVAFFPYSETAIDNAAPQQSRVDASGLHLKLAPSDPEAEPPKELAGVLVIEEQTQDGTRRRALAIGQAPPLAAPATGTPLATEGSAKPAATAASHADESMTFWSAAGLAFVGGLLLNLMPCVFPVLSIKVLSLVKQSTEAPGRVRLHGFAYTAGVLASFLALAGLLIALKSGGAGIGWGFQLQSPIVVATLAYLLLAMGLSLSGVVHVGGGISGIGDGLTRRSGLQGSFFTGVLATVVATPCTAPFMGAAVGFALTQAPLVGLTVFASLGLGLALPFLLLTLWPSALRAMPRPGVWMETVKGVLAFPIYVTVAWLVWVLAQQVSPDGLLAALVGLVLVSFAAWAWERARFAGRIATPLGRAAALAALAATIGLTAQLSDQKPRDGTASPEGVQAFTQAKLDALRAEGRNVFIDMTAAWCITCQVNERGTLSTNEVQQAFKVRDVVYMRGDWTNQNPEITRLLERYGRSGVPLYLLYAGKAEPAVLPQILTKANVLAEIERLEPRGRSRVGL